MKASIMKHRAKGDYYKTESTMIRSSEATLRVDVYYRSHMRYYLFECETKPNIKRLKAKGNKRKQISNNNMYILIVPAEQYLRKDWKQLRGYFDQVICYDEETDNYSAMMDLRILGKLQDIFLDHWMPVRCTLVKDTYWWLRIRKNLVKTAIRMVVQCSMCKMGIESPWMFCIRNNCPLQSSLYPRERVNFHYKSSNL
jgi:hypothetical protein